MTEPKDMWYWELRKKDRSLSAHNMRAREYRDEIDRRHKDWTMAAVWAGVIVAVLGLIVALLKLYNRI